MENTEHCPLCEHSIPREKLSEISEKIGGQEGTKTDFVAQLREIVARSRSAAAEEFARYEENLARIGRPPKPPTSGEKVSLGLKVTANIKRRLDRAARESGRTQSQEAESRIERSFDREDLLSEVLALAYGRETAGILIMLGLVMTKTGDATAHRSRFAKSAEHWTADPHAFDQAVQAAAMLLDATREDGPLRRRRPGTSGAGSSAAHWFANAMISAVRADKSGAKNLFADSARAIRSLLGPIAERIKELKP